MPTVLGVDDFALRRGHVYGTGKAIDVLDGREAELLAQWLRDLVEQPLPDSVRGMPLLARCVQIRPRHLVHRRAQRIRQRCGPGRCLPRRRYRRFQCLAHRPPVHPVPVSQRPNRQAFHPGHPAGSARTTPPWTPFRLPRGRPLSGTVHSGPSTRLTESHATSRNSPDRWGPLAVPKRTFARTGYIMISSPSAIGSEIPPTCTADSAVFGPGTQRPGSRALRADAGRQLRPRCRRAPGAGFARTPDAAHNTFPMSRRAAAGVGCRDFTRVAEPVQAQLGRWP